MARKPFSAAWACRFVKPQAFDEYFLDELYRLEDSQKAARSG